MHWGTEAWIQTHLLGYIAMLGLYILQSEHCYVPYQMCLYPRFCPPVLQCRDVAV